jgi:hypothetical protein
MEIVSNREEMIFRNEYEGKVSYKIGLSKKNKDGQFDKGYMQVRFKQGVELNNQTRIKINKAWLSFNTHEKKTYPYIFINDFSIVEDKNEVNPYEYMKAKVESDIGEQITITDEDLPF